MRWFAGIACLLALLIMLLPNLGAQDKKDPDKPALKADPKKDVADKKDPEKKDVEKKDAKKDEDKKDDEKDKKKDSKKDEEKLVFGQTITARLKRMDANSAHDFAIEVPQVDPMKVYQLNMWKNTEMARIMSGPPPRTPQAVAQRNQQMMQFQMNLTRKQNNEIYSLKEVEMRAAENCKVRAMAPPIEFDDKGRLKTYTQKELKELRGTSKLPGYPADFDRLSAGQMITVYLAKPPAKEKGEKISKGDKGDKADKGEGIAFKKKNLDDDDALMAKPEAVMILVVQEVAAAESLNLPGRQPNSREFGCQPFPFDVACRGISARSISIWPFLASVSRSRVFALREPLR